MSSGWSRRISKPQTEVGGPEREKVLGKPRVIDGPGEAGLSSQVLLVGTEIRKARGKSPHADHSFSRGTAVTCGQQAQSLLKNPVAQKDFPSEDGEAVDVNGNIVEREKGD